MKKLILITSLFLTACAGHKATVIRNDLAVDTSCPNLTKVITLLKSTDGIMIKKCGFWGLVGDKVKIKQGLVYQSADSYSVEKVQKYENHRLDELNEDLEDNYKALLRTLFTSEDDPVLLEKLFSKPSKNDSSVAKNFLKGMARAYTPNKKSN